MNSLIRSLTISRADKITLALALEEKKKRRFFNKLPTYTPYSKQLEFHAHGNDFAAERLLMAGNQLGKTVAGGAEWAMHLTGRYPDWWNGATFEKAVIMWASGVTGESTRDNPQNILVGQPANEELWGSGWIPKDAIKKTNRAMGIKNALDSVVVRYGGGSDIQQSESVLYFKSYEKGREKWQGPTIDGVWFDEEPPIEIYSEGRTRTQNGQRGIFTAITFTPLLGMSEVVRMFLGVGEDTKNAA